MKRGLKVTLMTVAVAMLGLQAMAMAPVISDIPSPIVGSLGTGTDATPYVFGDAIDLDAYVSDDVTADSALKWSYAITGTPIYGINGKDAFNAAALNNADVTNPAAANQINNAVDPKETVNVDGKANTITIRNVKLKPYTGTGSAASGSGIIDSQVVTLFASDGTTYSSKTVMFYTDEGGADRLSVTVTSTPGVTWTQVYGNQFEGTTANWQWDLPYGSALPLTSSTKSGHALCAQSTLTGGGFGGWFSPFGTLTLTDNSVYRIRLRMNNSQSTVETCPFWDVVVSNFNGTNGFNLYGSETLFLDNAGGANGVRSTTNGADYYIYWTPSPVRNTSWKNSVFTSGNDANNDAFLQFRILDVDNNAGITPLSDQGTLCLEEVVIDKVDLASLVATKTEMYNKSSFTKNVDANTGMLIGGDAAASFTGGKITVTPPSGDVEYGLITPGDTNNNIGTPSSMTDNYPCTWEANALYEMQFSLSAAANTYDVFWLGADNPTNEVITESYVTGALTGQPAMPTSTPQTYTAFFYGQNGTVAASSLNANRWRWRVALGNNAGLNFHANTGSFTINSVVVNKITLP